MKLTQSITLKRIAIGLILIGLILFCKGFLLVRKVLDNKNSSKIDIKTPFNKAIIVVVDGLRTDMAIPDSSSSLNWRNKLNVLYKLFKEDKGLFFRFKADPPTATSQRLSGLTAGNLPSFIEVSDNFSEKSSPQDNWVYQLLKAKRKVNFFGDDTWLHLYPYLKESTGEVKGYHSFFLFDLDTVDDAINEHMKPSFCRGS